MACHPSAKLAGFLGQPAEEEPSCLHDRLTLLRSPPRPPVPGPATRLPTGPPVGGEDPGDLPVRHPLPSDTTDSQHRQVPVSLYLLVPKDQNDGTLREVQDAEISARASRSDTGSTRYRADQRVSSEKECQRKRVAEILVRRYIPFWVSRPVALIGSMTDAPFEAERPVYTRIEASLPRHRRGSLP